FIITSSNDNKFFILMLCKPMEEIPYKNETLHSYNSINIQQPIRNNFGLDYPEFYLLLYMQ
ncbi:hypothetical protein, partial [Klebsiella pneumoniae]|uniref:hypothetical protein n=1 Tax=Klebsiella pneumoniae TaxID=573 RepID=UPI001C633EE5